MLQFRSIWRGWVELEGDPPLLIPRRARRGSIVLGAIDLRLEFSACPELSAVHQGRKFKLQNGGGFVGQFECTPQGTTGRLKPIGSGYSIDAEDLESAEFSAYWLPSEGHAEQIAIVRDAPTGTRKLRISPGGAIDLTPDLVGKTIKVRVSYPRIVVQTSEPISTLTAHLVGDLADEAIAYARIAGCRMLSSPNARSLHLQFESDRVTTHLLDAQKLDTAI